MRSAWTAGDAKTGLWDMPAALAACAAVGLALVSPWRPALANEQAKPSPATSSHVALDRDDAAGRLRVLVDGNEALVYQYGADCDLVHYWPVRSPSGKSMTVRHPTPYPHHRSFWFADKVQLAGGRDVSFYGALYSCEDRKNPKPPFRDHVRHVEFLPVEEKPGETAVTSKLVWEMDGDKPVLDELRRMRVVALGDGEYFLDLTFTVTASHGDVTFTSDAVHYAWPYVRMDPTFSVEQGGTITNSEGGINQAGTHGKEARWIDYSNTVEGRTEGLAVFCHPDGDPSPKWLTRDYGCFGPRRPDAQSGKRFTLRKGESLEQRVGVLVHRGDVKQGRVADRYEHYVEGKLRRYADNATGRTSPRRDSVTLGWRQPFTAFDRCSRHTPCAVRTGLHMPQTRLDVSPVRNERGGGRHTACACYFPRRERLRIARRENRVKSNDVRGEGRPAEPLGSKQCTPFVS